MSKLSIVFVVRFYCSNEDIEYGFYFKFTRDETINVTTSLESTSLSSLFWSRIYLRVGLFKHSLKYFANTLER